MSKVHPGNLLLTFLDNSVNIVIRHFPPKVVYSQSLKGIYETMCTHQSFDKLVIIIG